MVRPDSVDFETKTNFFGSSGNSLQQWPRIKKFIKSCESGEPVKKASVFSYEDLVRFGKMTSLNTNYWLVRKAVVALGYFGGLRNIELRNLRLESLKIADDGIEVEFPRAKQRKNIKVKILFTSLTNLQKIILLLYCSSPSSTYGD